MHAKHEWSEKIYDAWELDSKETSDIKQALEEAFMTGAAFGGTDSDLHQEAMQFVSENECGNLVKRDGEDEEKP